MKKPKAKKPLNFRFVIGVVCIVMIMTGAAFIVSRNISTSNKTLNTEVRQDLLNVCDGISAECGDKIKETSEPVIEDVKKDNLVDPVPSLVIDSDIKSVIINDIPGESTDHTFGTGLTIDFPIDWKIEHTNRIRRYMTDEPNFESNDKTLLTSPDGRVTVKFELIMQGPHGGPKYEVGPFDEYELKMIEYEQLPSYRDLYFASYLTKHEASSSSLYYIGVNSNIGLISGLRVGDRVGNLFYNEINSIGKISERVVVLWLEARFNSMGNNFSTNDFESAKATKNYETVKQIIESLHIKK